VPAASSASSSECQTPSSTASQATDSGSWPAVVAQAASCRWIENWLPASPVAAPPSAAAGQALRRGSSRLPPTASCRPQTPTRTTTVSIHASSHSGTPTSTTSAAYGRESVTSCGTLPTDTRPASPSGTGAAARLAISTSSAGRSTPRAPPSRISGLYE
jgi:hypothetical protein